MVLVGNKDELSQYEEVTNDEGISFAININAKYQRISAIDDLIN